MAPSVLLAVREDLGALTVHLEHIFTLRQKHRNHPPLPLARAPRFLLTTSLHYRISFVVHIFFSITFRCLVFSVAAREGELSRRDIQENLVVDRLSWYLKPLGISGTSLGSPCGYCPLPAESKRAQAAPLFFARAAGPGLHYILEVPYSTSPGALPPGCYCAAT